MEQYLRGELATVYSVTHLDTYLGTYLGNYLQYLFIENLPTHASICCWRITHSYRRFIQLLTKRRKTRSIFPQNTTSQVFRAPPGLLRAAQGCSGSPLSLTPHGEVLLPQLSGPEWRGSFGNCSPRIAAWWGSDDARFACIGTPSLMCFS